MKSIPHCFNHSASLYFWKLFPKCTDTPGALSTLGMPPGSEVVFRKLFSRKLKDMADPQGFTPGTAAKSTTSFPTHTRDTS